MAVRHFTFSSSGGSRRWFISDIPWSKTKESWEFLKCRSIGNWTVPVLRGEKTKVFEDMPDTVCGTPLASDSLKLFLEKEVPGAAQYLPVRIESPGIDAAHRRYWVINWLRWVACLDEARSLNEYLPENGGGVFKEWTVIDPSRIPPDFVVGRFKKMAEAEMMSQVLIRDDLMKKIVKAGFTGPQFRDVWYSTDPGAPAPLWKPGGGRVERDPPEGPWPGYH